MNDSDKLLFSAAMESAAAMESEEQEGGGRLVVSSSANPVLRDLLLAVSAAKAARDQAVYGEHIEKARAVGRWELQPGNVLGTNEAERARSAIKAQDDDMEYQEARQVLADTQRVLDEAEAELEAYRDIRRMDREAVMARLAEGGGLDKLP